MPTIVSIDFAPFLEKICDALGYSEPVYKAHDDLKRTAEVRIAMPVTSFGCTVVGDERGSFAESCESAARKMCVFLADVHKLMVLDINHDERVQSEQSAQLFQLKQDSLERMEKHLPTVTSYDVHPIEGVDFGCETVCIDFLQMLYKVVDRFNVPVTPVETFKLTAGVFVSWMSVTAPNTNKPSWYVVGDKCADMETAKQALSKKAIEVLMTKYQFEVEDINYHLLDRSASEAAAARVKYIAVKEHVLGLSEAIEPMAAVVEQDMITPRSIQSQIVIPSHPPNPPKNPQPNQASRSFASTIPQSLVPPEAKIDARIR